jgi:subtilisin family serine protease
VQFPSSLPSVLAVSAVGWRAAFPSDSLHTQAIPEGGGTQDGYFTAAFTCFGPEVDVCGPGVAIVSSVPPDNFAAADGTAMATAHVTGLAALVLAHHPDFQPDAPYAQKDARRVERLYAILRASARPFRIGDAHHAGYGLPDALRALGVASVAETRGQSEDAGTLRTLRELVAAAQLPGDLGAAQLRQQLSTVIQRAGLDVPAPAQPAPTGGVAWSSAGPPASNTGHAVLQMNLALRQAGLSEGGGSVTLPRSRAGPDTVQLADVLQQAGLATG